MGLTERSERADGTEGAAQRLVELGVPAPEVCVVLGSGKALDSLDLLQDVVSH